MEFSQILERIMTDRQITVYSLSKKMNVHQTTISNWLNGVSTPGYLLLKRLANTLNVSTDELLGTYTKPMRNRVPTNNPYDKYVYLLNKEIHGELSEEETKELKSYKCLNKIAGSLDKLTECGQEEAVKRVKELTEISKYRKPEEE